MIPLRLTAYEQSALAEVSSAMKSLQWSIFGKHEMPTQEQLEKFTDLAQTFDAVKWDTLYDRLHRSGENS